MAPNCESFTENDIPDLTGYVAIVTGGNSGIGYETTKQLALRNAHVYIVSRSKERIDAAIQQMKTEAGRDLKLDSLEMDLMDLKSVKKAANDVIAKKEKLDILINNAGIMTAPYKLTKDGHESQWQVNYLAPHTFASALLGPLQEAAAVAAESGDMTRVRVVNVSSDMAFFSAGPKTIHFEDPNMTNTKGFTELQQRYAHSKQAIIRESCEFNKRYSSFGITAYSVHPGIVKSGLQSHDTTLMGGVIRTLLKVVPVSSPLQGSYNSLFAATSPQAPQNAGKFFLPVAKVRKVNDWVSDNAAEQHINEKLWKVGDEVASKIEV